MIETSRSQSESPAPNPTRRLRLEGTHAETRRDPITGLETIFAPHRSARPDEFVASSEQINNTVECPFCSGNEDATLPAVWIGKIINDQYQIDVDGGSSLDWSVRVVPNLYPAVDASPPATPKADESSLFDRRPVFGGHEVFVESQRHLQSLSQLDLPEVQLTFLAYRDRIRHWRSIPGISYVSVFKNVGQRAGASLRHCHSQLIATDRVPFAVESTIKRMVLHRAETGCCLHCDLIRGEQGAKERIVWQDDSLIAFCPFASRLPMLLRISTRQHQARFEDLAEPTIESVSRLVRRAVSWLEAIRPGTAYNITLSTEPPTDNDPASSFHWSIDIFPRMTQIAGFEWISGCHINPVLPETAAATYRKLRKPKIRAVGSVAIETVRSRSSGQL